MQNFPVPTLEHFAQQSSLDVDVVAVLVSGNLKPHFVQNLAVIGERVVLHSGQSFIFTLP